MRDGQQHASITQFARDAQLAEEAQLVERLGTPGEGRRIQELRRRIHAQRILAPKVGGIVSKPCHSGEQEAHGTKPQQAGRAEQG